MPHVEGHHYPVVIKKDAKKTAKVKDPKPLQEEEEKVEADELIPRYTRAVNPQQDMTRDTSAPDDPPKLAH